MIHSTAIIHPTAELADNVEVGAYTIIGAKVKIDSGTWIGPHVVIQGPTQIGKDNRIFQFNSLGEMPQDKKYQGEATELIIGDRNIIREYCTFNRGTIQDIGKTVLGNDNWIMAYVHLAHDCLVGNNTIFANGATLAGHVVIGDYVILGGFSLIHQFCRIGQYAFTGMGTAVGRDIPPYVMVYGEPGVPRGINREGLKRHGFDAERIRHIKQAYRTLYRTKLSYKEAISHLEQDFPNNTDIQSLLRFCKDSQRGIIR